MNLQYLLIACRCLTTCFVLHSLMNNDKDNNFNHTSLMTKKKAMKLYNSI